MIEHAWTLRTWTETYCAERDIVAKSRNYYRYAVNEYEDWAGAPLSLFDACRLLNEYVGWRTENDASRYTAKTHRGAIGVLLREADRRELCVMPKRIRGVKVPDLDPQGFMPDELERLKEEADRWQWAMLSLAFDTGFRHADLARVPWSHVNEGNMTVYRIMQKTGRRHVAPISAESVEACLNLRPAAHSGDGRLVPLPYCREVFYRRWRALGARAGVCVFRRCMQATRRTASSMIAREHGDAAAAAFLGHSPASGLSVFLRFYRVGRLLDVRPPAPPRPF